MSAPTALDAGALISGLAWTVQQPLDDERLEAETYSGPEQRSLTRVAQLTRTHNDLCTQAVDPFEITAGLEAAGVSDRQARTEYGAASVFELAEAMYDLVPRRPTAAVVPVDPWRKPLRIHLLRGLLYGLPGLIYAVALIMLQAGFDAALLIGTTIVASGLGQGVSVLGHALTGRGSPSAAIALFRTAIVGGAVLGGLVVLVSGLTGPVSPASVLAGCLVLYLIAATVLMVMNAELRLLAVIAPGVTLAVMELSGVSLLPAPATLATFALCVAGAAVAAWTRLGTRPRDTVRHLRDGFGLVRVDRGMGWSYVFYGMATAGLASFAVIDVIGHPEVTVAAGPVALMMLPLVASLGIAEWLVYRLRSRAAADLRRTTSVAQFRILARREFAFTALLYAGVLGALTCAVIAFFPQQSEQPFVLSTVAYSVLGMAFLCATLLLSLGRHRLALGLTLGAVCLDTVLRLALIGESPEVLVITHLTVFTGLLLTLMPAAAYYYTRAGAHR
ncbi:hypothetical protein [Demequina sp. NBRC 110056]|uniref:hypothetical protein n=1 Tax=Demequina sp. NBRC 110056 TaxID=1570345 RepID=UPI0013564B1B|nr:hypothetical protein [Demequina sp. NBRC 110056]